MFAVEPSAPAATARAASAITVAGLVLAPSFAVLALVPVRPFRELAFSMSVGLVIDAFLVRTLLVPSLITLAGPVSAWPGRLAPPARLAPAPPPIARPRPRALRVDRVRDRARHAGAPSLSVRRRTALAGVEVRFRAASSRGSGPDHPMKGDTMSEMLLDGDRAIRGTSPEPLSSRIVIRCYGSYRDAKRAYDRLRVVGRISDRRMTVVARGLEWQEPLGGTAALRLGAWLGALVGAWIGLILWALDFANGSTGWFGQTLAGAVLGAAPGAALALAIRGLTRRDPAVRETGYVAPRQYDILVEEDLAPVAHEVLGAE